MGFPVSKYLKYAKKRLEITESISELSFPSINIGSLVLHKLLKTKLIYIQKFIIYI